VAVFREVEVFPNGGFADRPWVDDPDEEAFARVARGVCEAYSQALPALALPGKAGLLRLYCEISGLEPEVADRRPRPDMSAPASAAVEVYPKFLESFEFGWVWVPVGFAGQPVQSRRVWALGVVHEAARLLAMARGWDPDILESARRHAMAQDLRFTWDGPWKSAPDRRHKARGVAGIGDDGMGHLRLEVATRGGEPVILTEPAMASCDGTDLVWACKTVRWDGSSRVTVAAIMDPYGMNQRLLEVRLRVHSSDDPSDHPSGATAALIRPGQRQVRFHPPAAH